LVPEFADSNSIKGRSIYGTTASPRPIEKLEEEKEQLMKEVSANDKDFESLRQSIVEDANKRRDKMLDFLTMLAGLVQVSIHLAGVSPSRNVCLAWRRSQR
jgi:hypothetical protein